MDFSRRRAASLAIKDVVEGFASPHIWGMLGWQEIRQRYRRSKLGPFWLTISTGAMVGGMGPLYGRLLNADLSLYFSYLATSLVVWQLVAGIVTDSCQAFISAEGVIKQIRLPLTVHVLRVVWRNLIMFAHNFVIVVIVLAFFPPPTLDWHVILMPVGLLLLAFNGVWLGLFLGTLSARFRDIPLIVNSLVQVLFFLTPVMWKASMLGGHAWAAQLNPLYHFLEIVRAPLVSGGATAINWMAVILITVAGWTLTYFFFSRFRARIAYWV